MGFISKGIFDDILSLVLQNRFADIEPLSDPQNEALFEILNPESYRRRLAMGNRSYSSAFQIFAENYFKKVSLSKECRCGGRLPVKFPS